MADTRRTAEVIDVHAHVYPDGSLTEVVKDRSEFKLVETARGESLLYRGSHAMSIPKGGGDLNRRIESMNAAGIDMAVLSVGALNIGWAGPRSVAAARMVN